MIKTSRFLFIMLVAGLSLSVISCPLLNTIFSSSEESSVDLSVVSVAPLTSGEDVIGVRLVLRNGGSKTVSATYSIFFSENLLISDVEDEEVYRATVSIEAGKDKQIDLARASIENYMADNSISLPGGDYYIGVLVDPDDTLSEDNEGNNEGVSSDRFPVIIYLDGTITFGLSNALAYNGMTVFYAILESDSDPDVFDNFLAWSSFPVASGSGSAVAQAMEGGNFLATGGKYYSIYFFIDVDGSSAGETSLSEIEPNAGDVSSEGPTDVPQVNGDQVVTFNASTGLNVQGAIRCSVEGMIAADGKDLVMFIIPPGMELFGPDDIIASFIATVDTSGNASGTMHVGFPPTAEVFFGNLETDYSIYAVIDMNGALVSEEARYSDPYDYALGFNEDARSFTYEEWGHSESYGPGDFVQNPGIVIVCNDLTAGNGTMAYFSLALASEPDTIVGSGELTLNGGDGTGVIMDQGSSWRWSDQAGLYLLDFYLDLDASGTLSTGDLNWSQDIIYTEEPQTLTIDYNTDFTMIISSVSGVNNETRTDFGELDFSIQNGSLEIASGDVVALEGGSSLKANFLLPVPEENAFPWLNFNYQDRMDISGISNFVFSVNASAAPDWDTGMLELMFWDDQGNSGYVSCSDYSPVSNGDWDTYTVPIADLLGGSPELDLTRMNSFKFGSPKNSSGQPIACTLYFDDMYFE